MRQSQLWNTCAVRAESVNVRHAIVSVVIGVVLCGRLVGVRFVPIVVCDDAVVRPHSLVLTAVYRSLCFHRSHST